MPKPGGLGRRFSILVPVGLKVGDVIPDLFPEAEPALLDQDHEGCGRGHGLGERGQVEKHVLAHGQPFGHDLARAESSSVNHPPLAPDNHNSAREIAPPHGLEHQAVHPSQLLRGKADLGRTARFDARLPAGSEGQRQQRQGKPCAYSSHQFHPRGPSGGGAVVLDSRRLLAGRPHPRQIIIYERAGRAPLCAV